MRPKLNEDSNPKENMLLNDINLLGNPKKTRGMSSSEEETENTYTAESEVMTEGDSDENNFDPFNNDEESGSSGSGEDETSNEGTNTTSQSGEETNTTASSRRRPPQRQKTIDEINQEKQEMLYRLERFEQNGFKASRKFNMTSNYDDIKFEYERIKKQRDVDKSIKFQRKILMAVCSGVEFLNGKFDPLNVKLDGWSESIYENLQEYDEVFEDLHEKYKEKVKVAPELKLLMMVGGSAFSI
jgi:cobalamin biosynthesis protein CobT